MLTARFRTQAIDSAELDARMLVGAALGLDLTGLIAAAARPVTADEVDRVLRISRGGASPESPSRAFSGSRSSGACRCNSRPATLVPRPDTETVVELALEIWRAERHP